MTVTTFFIPSFGNTTSQQLNVIDTIGAPVPASGFDAIIIWRLILQVRSFRGAPWKKLNLVPRYRLGEITFANGTLIERHDYWIGEVYRSPVFTYNVNWLIPPLAQPPIPLIGDSIAVNYINNVINVVSIDISADVASYDTFIQGIKNDTEPPSNFYF